jgi:DNA polymerase I-like protein with 3'-5' exonuclease and polymerase domains
VWVYDEFRACGIRGGLIGTVHDELLCEVVEDDAEDARDLLGACMLMAFVETFPKASQEGVVEAKVGKSWDAVRSAGQNLSDCPRTKAREGE